MEFVMPKKSAPRIPGGPLMPNDSERPGWIIPRKPQQPRHVPTAAEEALAESSFGERMLIGAGARMADIPQGLKQTAGILRNLFPGEPSTWPQEVADKVISEQDVRNALRRDTAAMIGGGVADVASALPMARALKGPVIGSAAIGGTLTGPMTPRADPGEGQLLEDMVGGAAFGGLGGAATQGIASAVGRGVNSARGRFADPEAARRAAAFEAWDVPGSYGDISQRPLAMFGENVTQYAPMSGRAAFLKNQAEQMARAINDMPSRIAGPIASSSKEDLGQALARSIKEKYASAKRQAGQLYDNVARVAKDPAIPPVQPQQLALSAKQLKNDYPDLFDAFQDKRAVSRLNSVIEGTGPQSSTILGPSGRPIQKPAQLSFDDARWLDKRLGAMIRQGERRMWGGDMDPEAFRQLTSLQQALRNDIDSWAGATGNPQISQGIQEANAFFKENVVPFRQNRTIQNVLRDRIDTDKLPSSLFKFDSPTLAGDSKRFLTPEGELAAQHFMLNQAKDRAMTQALSPRMSLVEAGTQRSLGETGPKMFSAQQLDDLAQFENLLGSGSRSIRLASDPAESARLLGLTAILRPVLGLGAKGYASLMQSPGATRFMLADPRMYTGSGALGKASEEAVRRSGIGAGTGLFRFDEDAE